METNESFIQGKDIVDNLTEAFYNHLAAVNQNVGAINNLNQGYGKLPSDYLKTIKQITDAQIKQARSEKELYNASIASQRLKQSEISTMIKENALLRDQIKTQQAQEKQIRSSAGAYQTLSSELNALRATTKNLAADMYLLEQAGESNTDAFRLLSSQYESSKKRVLDLDSTLKTIDSSVGQNQRNVGNYKSTFDGLGNSINQITRELPAFAVSANTGFLAISNNLPILADELGRIRRENELLRAEGKNVVPALTQLAKSFFSWGTALSLGVTALTVYGGSLVKFTQNLFKTKSALDAVSASQKILSDAKFKSQKEIVDEITSINLYLETAKDETKSREERLIAVKKLQDQYAFYFGKLSEGEILAGKTEKAELKLNKALQARENLMAISESYNANQKNLVTIQTNLIKQDQLLTKERKEQQRLMKAGRDGTMNAITVADLLTDSQNREVQTIGIINTLKKSQNYYQDVNNKLIKEAVASKKIAIGLEFEAEKENEKSNKLQYENTVDFEANRFLLLKTRLENEAAYQKSVFEDEKNGYADRENALKEYSKIILDIADITRVEELRLIKRGTDQEKAELNRRAKEGEITRKNANDVISSIDKQYTYDRQLIYENYSKAVIDANAEVAESLEGVWKGLSEQDRAIKNLQLLNDNARQLGLYLSNVDSNTSVNGFVELENKIRSLQDLEKDNNIENLRLQRQSLDNEIQRISALQKSEINNKAINDLLIQQKEIDSQILDIDNQRAKAVADIRREMKQTTQDFLNGLSTSGLSSSGFGSLTTLFDQTTYKVINSLGEIEERTGSTFDKLFESATSWQEKFAVVFNTLGNVAKDVFAFMTQNQEAYFQRRFSLLERDRDLAISFSDQSETQKAQIEKQYEERRRQVRLQELRFQQRAAIFNATISGAQAAVAAYAASPLTGGILAGIIAGITAAQIAVISSQQLPAFATGGITESNGNILVNDAKGSNYREVIQTPSGNTYKPQGRNTVMNVPKGTRIFKSYKEHSDHLNSLLSNTGIAPFASGLTREGNYPHNNYITKSDLENVMMKTLGSMPVTNYRTVFDRSGFNNFVEKGHSEMEIRNNHLSLSGKSINR